MAFKKEDLNVRLRAISRRETKADALGVSVEEEIYAKTATRIGQIDGEILGGVKSLGQEAITPNEVIENTSIGQLTDKVGVSGLVSSIPNIQNATGLSSGTNNSSITVIAGGGPMSIADATIEAEKRVKIVNNEIGSFASQNSSSSSITNMNIPTIKFGTKISDTVKNISGVASFSGADKIDAVSNETGISGFSPKNTIAKNELSTISNVNALSKTDFTNITNPVTNFTKDVGNVFTTIYDAFDKGLNGFLQNVTETLTGNGDAYLTNIVSGGINLTNPEKKRLLSQNASGDPVEKTKAVKTIVNKSGNVSSSMKGIIADTNASSVKELNNKAINVAKERGIPDSEINAATNEITTVDDKLSLLDTTIGGSVVVEASLFDDPEALTQTANKWSGKVTPQDAFTFVSSVEELDAEFSTIKRDITEVVVHATETYSNSNIGSPEIHDIHNKLGHDGIGYHYVIRKDGTLQRGRPVNQKGDHASVNGHNDLSIGIVLVGGIKAPTGQENPTQFHSPHSFNRAQFTTLERFLASYYRKFPGGQVFGHNDIDIDELDPYFDVVDYVESMFRKQNKTTDPLNKGPLKPSEIL